MLQCNNFNTRFFGQLSTATPKQDSTSVTESQAWAQNNNNDISKTHQGSEREQKLQTICKVKKKMYCEIFEIVHPVGVIKIWWEMVTEFSISLWKGLW